LQIADVLDRIEREYAGWQLSKSIAGVERFLDRIDSEASPHAGPVFFFNASTRIHTLSINAAISLIASWSLRAAGIPVYYAVCDKGMQQCVLGTDWRNLEKPPPCKYCVRFSKILFPKDRVVSILSDLGLIEGVKKELTAYSLEDLKGWSYEGNPLGQLCLPGLRWALRMHHLNDDESTRTAYRTYLASAAGLVHQFEGLFDQYQPSALVVFNGLTYPEAVARHIAENRGISVITHEVGLRPYSAFFSHEDATFRELEVGPDFKLDAHQETRLEGYLRDRFQGKYTMAGIRFWPEMTAMTAEVEERIQAYSQVVPVFTNVIFDTSQAHANTIFTDMFDWLDALQIAMREHADTLFILRAHPDEDRPGKESRESVSAWVEHRGVGELPNVIFLGPGELVSSYEIIRRAKVVLVYNSSIGLEASILGKAVLCAGRARYTQVPTVFFPQDRRSYLQTLEQFLSGEEIKIPTNLPANSRAFLYYELYRASLDFSEFLKPYPRMKGMTLLQDFEHDWLHTSRELNVVREGILEGKAFIYQEEIAQ
jgi:hypothetical protein